MIFLDTPVAPVMVGTVFGLIRIVTAAALPCPDALVALAVTRKSPLCVGVPTICPDPLTDKPVGRPVLPA